MNIKTTINTALLASLLLGSFCQADITHGQATGKRQHKPISVSKEIDKATPMLAKIAPSDAKSSASQKNRTAYRLCPDGSMINPGEKCPEKSSKR